MVDELRIGADYLATQIHSEEFRLEALSHRNIEKVFQSTLSEDLVEFSANGKVIERGVLFATQLMGDDDLLSDDQFATKQRFHEAMALEFSTQWLLDDLCDSADRIPTSQRTPLLELVGRSYSASFQLDDARIAATTDDIHTSVMLRHFASLFVVRNDRLLTAGIDISREGIPRQLMLEFWSTWEDAHRHFSDYGEYRRHRANNCGLPNTGYWSALWYSYITGIDMQECEAHPRATCEIIRQFAMIGALCNDLAGYEKDLQEGVANAVIVVARGRPEPDESDRLAAAFDVVIEMHNGLLENLKKELRNASPGEAMVLHGMTRSAWACRILHEQNREIYNCDGLNRAIDRAFAEDRQEGWAAALGCERRMSGQ